LSIHDNMAAGLDASGEHMVMHRLPGVVGGRYDTFGGAGLVAGGMSLMADAATSVPCSVFGTAYFFRSTRIFCGAGRSCNNKNVTVS
jgi:hypothetical protein